MQMDVPDALPGIRPRIDDNAKPIVGDAFLPGDLGCNTQQMPQHGVVFR
jgi:hypothetical protein